MLLNEIIITPYEYSIRMIQNTAQPAMQAEFQANDGGTVTARIVFIVADRTVLLNFSKENSHKLTGTGDQFKILATVMDFYKTHLAKSLDRLNATSLTFSADASEPSRVRFYSKRAVPEFSKLLSSEWTGPKIQNTRFGKSSDVEYTWTRPDPEESKPKPYRSMKRGPENKYAQKR